MKKVVIVDDSLFMRTTIKDMLIKGGYEIIGEAVNGEDAINMISDLNPDLVTLDNILPDMIGIDILSELKKDKNITSRFVMISAVGNESVQKEALDIGADFYIVKPFTQEILLSKLENLS